jgi:4-amino-4-deoxy-L-arabinose transferase-like glycosyltransferase
MTKKTFFILALALTTLFFLSRIYNLTLLPIFTDEAIYLSWAQIAKNDLFWIFISLTDGKQPLLIWLIMPLMKLVADPLLAGRLASVLAGFFGMVGMGFLGWVVSKKASQGLLASFLYLISPFFLWYDRLALMDGLLDSLGIWSLAFSILLVRTLSFKIAVLLGVFIGLGMLTKSSAVFFLYLLPVSVLVFDWKRGKTITKLAKWLGLFFLVFLLSESIYAILRLSAHYYIIAQKNSVFVLSLKEFFEHPFQFFVGNLHGLTVWLIAYLTVPFFVLVIISFFWSLRKNFLLTTYLFLCFSFPFLALATFGKIIYPRFILFMTPPLFLLVEEFISGVIFKVKNKIFSLIVLLLIFSAPLYFDWQIIFNPINTPLPPTDREQFLDGWPAGFGIKETVAFLKEEAKKGKIFVGTEGTFGLFPASLELYLADNKNIEIKGYWPASKAFPDLIEKAKAVPTYFISKETEKFDNPHLQLLFKYRRGSGNTFLQVFKVVE